MRRGETGTSRTTPRWLMGLALALLGARVASGAYESKHPSVPTSLVHWVAPKEAEAQSRERQLPIFYDVSAEWCVPCRELDEHVFNDDSAARDINAAFIPVRLVDKWQEEGENEPDVARIVNKYHIEVFPTLLVVSPEGKLMKTRYGYGGVTDTLLFLGLPSPYTM